MTSAPISTAWKIQPRKPDAEARLRSELGVTPLVAMLLVQRGYEAIDEADHFLNDGLDHLHDPSSLPDFAIAESEIVGAIERKDKIYIHGDYDVDGVTSAALLYRFLKSLGANVEVHVPHRIREGYGIHRDAVDAAHALGAKLFLTCDCGVAAIGQVAYARELGMRVVVTDHHHPGEVLPDAHAVVNPHRHDSQYPFSDLCGAGVAFKLAAGIAKNLGHPVDKFYRAFLDLATLGTIADIMPLKGENRIIVKHGLSAMKSTKKVGLQALLRQCLKDTTGAVTAGDVGFKIGPRLNAAGRIDDAALSLELLLESDYSRAQNIVQDLEQLNTARQTEERRMVQEAIEDVQQMGLADHPVIVVGKVGWHHGVIGLVAGKLVEHFARPAFVVGIDSETGEAKGSARSLSGFHLAEALAQIKDIAPGGGHELAAGFSVDPGDLDLMREKLTEIARNTPTYQPGLRTMEITAEVDADEIDEDAVDSMQQMEPFGCGNPTPVFATRGVEIDHVKELGRDGLHLQFEFLTSTGKRRIANAWRMAPTLSFLKKGDRGDVAYKVTNDLFQGNRRLRWELRDWSSI